MDIAPGKKALAYARWELTVCPDRDTPQRATRPSRALGKGIRPSHAVDLIVGSTRVPDLDCNAHPLDLQVN